MHSKRRVSVQLGVVALLVPLALSGCAAISGESGATDGALQKVRVGELRLVDTVPLRYAIEKGYFKDEGLEIDLTTGAKGSVNIDNVLGDAIDIGMTSYPPAISAHVKSQPLTVVADAVETKPDSIVLVVKRDSPIRKLEELAGKKIANSSVKGISEMAMNSHFRMLGIDYKKVTYVSAQIADMPSLVTRGDVDAAIIAEPHVQVAYREGTQKLYDPFSGATAAFPWSGLVAKKSWVDSHRDVVAKFQRALSKAAAASANDRNKVVEILINHVKVQQDIAQLVVLPNYPTSVDPNRLQRVVELMKENGETGPNNTPLQLDMKTMMVGAST